MAHDQMLILPHRFLSYVVKLKVIAINYFFNHLVVVYPSYIPCLETEQFPQYDVYGLIFFFFWLFLPICCPYFQPYFDLIAPFKVKSIGHIDLLENVLYNIVNHLFLVCLP